MDLIASLFTGSAGAAGTGAATTATTGAASGGFSSILSQAGEANQLIGQLQPQGGKKKLPPMPPKMFDFVNY